MPGADGRPGTPSSGPSPTASGAAPIESESPRNALVLAALVALCVAAVYLTPLRELVDEIEHGVRPEWLFALRARAEQAGALAQLACVLGGAFVVAIGVPRLALALAAGAVFGWLEGTALAQLGTLLGCWATFAVGRRLGHAFIASIVARRLPRAKALLDFIARNELVANLVLRLAPIGNSFATNLLFSVSSASSRTFLLATFLGVLPSTAIAALIGSAAKGTELAARLLGAALALAVLSVAVGEWVRRLRRAGA